MSHLGTAYLRAYDELRTALTAGRYGPEFILDDAPFRSHYDDTSWQRAIAMLERDGLVHARVDGSTQAAELKARSVRSTSFEDDYSSQGRKPSIRTLDLRLVTTSDLDPKLVERFGDSIAEPIWVRHHHVQSVDDVPHAICDSYIPLSDASKDFESLRDGGSPLYAMYARSSIVSTKKTEHLVVDAPTSSERELLDLQIRTGVPVVRLYAGVWSGDSLIEICTLVDRADLYEFRYTVPL